MTDRERLILLLREFGLSTKGDPYLYYVCENMVVLESDGHAVGFQFDEDENFLQAYGWSA